MQKQQKMNKLILNLLFKVYICVDPLGYDDGSAPADHCFAAQSGQHQ